MRTGRDERTGEGSGGGAARLYLVYAALFLGVVLGLGVWLRAVFVWPVLKGAFTFQYLVHAHSHLAFFGWVTPALFGLVTAAARPGAELERKLRLHAHALGALSAAALGAFALTGYSALSIAVSALHVLLWWVFALPLIPCLRAQAPAPPEHPARAAVRPPAGAGEARRFYAAALVLLLVAGTATLLPGIMMARGVENAWLKELGVKLFLTPFIGGWLGLGAMGAVYGRIGRRPLAGWALALTAAGVVPSTLLFVGAPAPWGWPLWVGRAGSLLLGAGGVAFALDLVGARRPGPLLRLAGLAAALKGALELAAATGAGGTLLHDRSIILAYLHLALLGLVTPALLAAAYGPRAHAGRAAPETRNALAGTALHGLGLALMCGALLGLGWPAAARVLAAAGIPFLRLFPLAFAGGALSALALAVLLLGGARAAPAPTGRTAPLQTAETP